MQNFAKLALVAFTGVLTLQAAEPLAASGGKSASLADYADKYPFDKVNGVSFRANRVLVAAINEALPRSPAGDNIARQVLKPENAVDAPIRDVGGNRLYAHSFDPTDGGETNWAILVAADGSKAAVCFSTDAVYGDGSSTWFSGGQKLFELSRACPGDDDEFAAQLGDWEIGANPS